MVKPFVGMPSAESAFPCHDAVVAVGIPGGRPGSGD
jgi:hypothetical protein